MSDIETIVKVMRFSRAKDWSAWKELFLAKIGRKDPVVRQVFDLKEEFKFTTEDGMETQEITKNKATMRKAYEELLMYILTYIHLHVIYKPIIDAVPLACSLERTFHYS